jgi:hypothetical protein
VRSKFRLPFKRLTKASRKVAGCASGSASIFGDGVAPIPEMSEPPSAPATISELSADNEVALELALWDSVKDGSSAELESYLEQYPDGTFASLPEHGLMQPRFRPQIPRRRHPREAAAEALDLAFGIP